MMGLGKGPLPETNIAPARLRHPQRKWIIFQSSPIHFQLQTCWLRFREGNSFYTPWNWHFRLENRPSQKQTSIPTIIFQVRTVSFREGICCYFGYLSFNKKSVGCNLGCSKKKSWITRMLANPERINLHFPPKEGTSEGFNHWYVRSSLW